MTIKINLSVTAIDMLTKEDKLADRILKPHNTKTGKI